MNTEHASNWMSEMRMNPNTEVIIADFDGTIAYPLEKVLTMYASDKVRPYEAFILSFRDKIPQDLLGDYDTHFGIEVVREGKIL